MEKMISAVTRHNWSDDQLYSLLDILPGNVHMPGEVEIFYYQLWEEYISGNIVQTGKDLAEILPSATFLQTTMYYSRQL